MKTIEERMAAYAAYHKNPKNKFTHFIGVPMVYYSPLIPIGWIRFEIVGWEISLAWILFIIVMLWYFSLDITLATIMTIISIPLVMLCDKISKLPFQESLTIFLIVKIIGWIIQLIGHYFEGRRPALVDNLIQALMAPLFLIVEVMFFFGLRREFETIVRKKVLEYQFPE